jgi:SAM-dependent methyltransferase
MGLRQVAWRACYELLALRVRRPEWAFMNYGYAPVPGDGGPDGGPGDGRAAVPLEVSDAVDRFCIQLYAHVLEGVDVAGADVLEVGSGRGGGASWVARCLGAGTTTGVDLSSAAVALSRRHRRGPGLRFVQGDALHLPFPDASFDVVVNVESSHCYPSMEAFVAEVTRVLRPGGAFVWADLRGAGDVEAVRAQLVSSGLAVVRERDITAAVLHALHLDDERKAALVRAWIPRPFRALVRPFAGLEGTRNEVGFAAGTLRYRSAHLVRT